MKRFLCIFYIICIGISGTICWNLFQDHMMLRELAKKEKKIERQKIREPELIPEIVPETKKKDQKLYVENRQVISFNKDTFAKNLSPKNQNIRSWTELRGSISESLKYCSKKPETQIAAKIDENEITWGDIKASLTHLLELLPKLDQDPDLFAKEFVWVPLHNDDPFFYTGYYHPKLVASLAKKDGYVPIHTTPKGRKKGIPFYTRKEILNGAIAETPVLAWAKDPFEAFLLEVQGSGCLDIEDGEDFCVRYDGQNGHKYKSSRRILEDHNLLKRADIETQRQFFSKHPEHLSLLLENPSYVFFAKSRSTKAMGAMGRPLHAWQSIAVDRRKIPLGAIVAIGVFLPDMDKGAIPFHAITFAQDTGGAIKKNRIDIFCGETDRASYVSAKLDSAGPAWLLLAKKREVAEK